MVETMLQRASVLCFIIFVAGFAALQTETPGQRRSVGFKGNNCVTCHSRISSPPELSSRYLDWRVSPHKAAGVGCEKCHGGDALNRNTRTLHEGVIAPSNKASRIHESNLTETCGACHKDIVNSFVESTHHEKAKAAEFAPKCTTCHGHMASSVATYPAEAAGYCSRCHNTVNGMLPPRPEIPQQARALMEAIGRTNHIVKWIDELLSEAQRKNINVTKEKEDLRLLKRLLGEAKAGWHTFVIDGAIVKANKGFDDGISIRDRLTKKLGNS
jgi:hypothetical protein